MEVADGENGKGPQGSCLTMAKHTWLNYTGMKLQVLEKGNIKLNGF